MGINTSKNIVCALGPAFWPEPAGRAQMIDNDMYIDNIYIYIYLYIHIYIYV